LVNGEAGRYVVLAVPGANTFKESWAEHMALSDVWLAYDHDDAGQKGIERVRKVLSKRSKFWPMAKSLSAVVWPPATPDKFDCRDLFVAEKNNPSDAAFCQEHYGTATTPEARLLRFIENSRVVVPLNAGSPAEGLEQFRASNQIEAIPCNNFTDLSNSCAEHLYWTENLRDILLTLLAVNLSTRIVDNPLWLYVIGPPSSGKTTLIECVAANEKYGYSTSRLTGIDSGYKETPDDQTDHSMVPRFRDKMVFVKDGTLMFSMAAQTRVGIMGELRDLYDGSHKADYRNAKHNHYDATNFTMGIGITNEIRKFARQETALGERFLMAEIWDAGSNAHVERSIENTIDGFRFNLEAIHRRSLAEVEDEVLVRPHHHGKLLELKQRTVGFLDHLHEVAIYRSMPAIPDWYKSRVAALARLVAILRTVVARDRNSGDDPILYPRAESPMRIASQLTKMGLACCFVLGKPAIDEEIYRVLVRLTHDTAFGWTFLLTRLLAESDHNLSVDELTELIGLSNKTVTRKLHDLQFFGMLRKEPRTPEDDKANGNVTWGWALTNTYTEVWRCAFGGLSLDGLRDLVRIHSVRRPVPINS
jgi:hypothetical protein